MAAVDDLVKTGMWKATADVVTALAGVATTASAAELNYNDIATLGTLAASKTWTSDASLDTTMPTGGLLTVAAGGSIVVNGAFTPAVEIVTTTNLLTAAENGSTYVLNSATGFVTTLPAAALGLRFNFIVGPLGVANAQNHTIIVPGGANLLFGCALVAGVHVGCSAQDTINIVGTSGTTALPGDWVEVFCDGTNWNVRAQSTTAGSITFTGG